MARLGIIFGLLLCGLTAAALVNWPSKIPTQFVPMMLGIPILFCGVVSLNPHRRKYAMNVAAAIASLGAVMGSARVLHCLARLAQGDEVHRYALRVIVVMSVLCITFLVATFVSALQSKRRHSRVPVSDLSADIND